MSVFTTVTHQQMQLWLSDYALGELLSLQGIAAGITNTNYFVTTSNGRYVLTLFEKTPTRELPYFLELMAYLADRGVPCPHPLYKHDGSSLSELNGKPAALVTCLQGKSLETPTAAHCAEIGRVLAQLHLAGWDFPAQSKNQRDNAWRSTTATQVMHCLSNEDQALLTQELTFQAGLDLAALPKGVIHADLFRDNVLFDGDHVGGLIDFYYACHDTLLYDVAIAVNDWCVLEAPASGLDSRRVQALLQAYQQIRPLNAQEQAAWPGLLRIAALRFWLSRLYDLHFPQVGELTHAKDPEHFKRLLNAHIQQPQQLTVA